MVVLMGYRFYWFKNNVWGKFKVIKNDDVFIFFYKRLYVLVVV